MFLGTRGLVVLTLVSLSLIGGEPGNGGCLSGAAPAADAAPEPDAVARWIDRLSSADFKTRQQATDQLEKMGPPILPSLRKAAKADSDLEFKRRVEQLIQRIQDNVYQAEAKRWDDLDANRRGIRERLFKILQRSPKLTDHDLATAVYILTLGRSPTAEEATEAEKALAGADVRAAGLLAVARPLVNGKEYNSELATANLRAFKIQKELAKESDVTAAAARIFSDKALQKESQEAGTTLEQQAKTDQCLIEAAFLTFLSRFPTTAESKSITAHLQKTKDRRVFAADLLWALMNSNEFLLGM